MLLLSAVSASAQSSLNTTLLGHMPFPTALSNIKAGAWNGREYALVGRADGLAIVDVTVPSQPQQVFFHEQPYTIWREPFYWNGYAFCVNEDGGGMLIVDMNGLPGNTDLPVAFYEGVNFPFTRSHTMFVDEQGRGYLFGANHEVGGVIILDLSNPMSPVELGQWQEYYIHDGFVRGDTLWAACVYAGLAVVIDVSDPADPQTLASWATPSNFTHNMWPSDDNSYVFTTDEVGSAYITGYDVTDLSQPTETHRVRHPLSEGSIPHNTHWLNGFLVTSHYRDGLTIHDASDPESIILTGWYDTSPLEGGGFDGAWGAWPFLPSGNIVVSDIQEGLFIIGPTYVRAARLKGTVRSAANQAALNGALIEILGTDVSAGSNVFGRYSTGMPQAGTFEVRVSRGGYLPQTVSGVQLVNGETLELDFELVPDVPFAMQALVTDSETGLPVPSAIVSLRNNFFDYDLVTDQDGMAALGEFYAGTYAAEWGRWGYVTECGNVSITQQSASANLTLTPGYSDDFALDLGWTVSGTATAGIFVRGAANGTTYNGFPSAPPTLPEGGCGNGAYLTGNAGGSAGNDDVDDGYTLVTSPPMDLTGVPNPYVGFTYWFFMGGGNGSPNDEMLVILTNGTDSVVAESLPMTFGYWQERGVAIGQHIAVNGNVRVGFLVRDRDPGHLVEGGIDLFHIGSNLSSGSITERGGVTVFPNPAGGAEAMLRIDAPDGHGSARVLDLAGRQVVASIPIQAGLNRVPLPEANGVYLVEATFNGDRSTRRLAVQR